MNKLLNPISWTAYLETIALLAIVYYVFIGWKYYQPEIGRLMARISGQQGDSRELPAALRYEAPEQAAGPVSTTDIKTDASPPAIAEEMIGDAYELAQHLTECIASATDKPFAPAILIPKIRKILNDYPDIAATADREQINALIVRECEKTGTALLSESEVDRWWSA